MRIVVIAIVMNSATVANAEISSYCTQTFYRTFDDFQLRIDGMQRDYPDFATLITVGTATTPERGETINGIEITSTATGAGVTAKEKRPRVIITGGLHANEWIGTEVAIGLAEYLIANRTSETPQFDSKTMTIKKLLENLIVDIVPVLNPDGYIYSQPSSYADNDLADTSIDDTQLAYIKTLGWNADNSSRRHVGADKPYYCDWRKNRRYLASDAEQWTASNTTSHPAAIPYGVDINRNFTVSCTAKTQDTNPWNYLSYAGIMGSEMEMQAEMTLAGGANVAAVVDLHAGSMAVLYPWAYTNTSITSQSLRPSMYEDGELFKKMAEKMAKTIGSEYYYSNSYEGANFCGTARDGIFQKNKIAAFNIELSTKYQPNNISGACNENTMKGIAWLLYWAADQGFRSKPKLYLGD
jgi:hypothetical protein